LGIDHVGFFRCNRCRSIDKEKERGLTMAIDCEIILRWEATPEQLSAVGLALWSWCLSNSADAGMYPYLNNQTLSDLIAGKFPVTSQLRTDAGQPGFHFHVRDEASSDGSATIERMRRAIPRAAIEDIVVAGKSWRALSMFAHAGPT
jgi:hypothetical protein